MSNILDVRALSKNFGGLKAVDSVSFSLVSGDITALIGPNGAGKTTCFNLLSGALQSSSGQIEFNDREITAWPAHKRARAGIGRTFQVAATFRSMSVVENIETALLAAGRDETAAASLLDEVGIPDKTSALITELAYGDVKRVELAMALAGEPALLLLDEPTAGMASEERLNIMARITDLVRARGISVLFTEHDMDAVFGYANRVLAMDQGQLIADGTPAEIRANTRVQQVYLGTEDPAEGRDDGGPANA